MWIDDIGDAIDASSEEVAAGPEPERCEYCDTPYRSPAALIACEIRCAQDRGRE